MVGTGVTVGLCIVFFILGVLLSTLFLVLVPTIHRFLVLHWAWLTGRCCGRNADSENTDAQKDGRRRDLTTSDNYSEIDINKTQTFTGNGNQIRMKQGNIKGKQQSDDTNMYQNVDAAIANAKSQDQCRPAYEALGSVTADERRFSNHTYFSIVEPGTSKRLQVKLVNDNTDTLQSDENHLYFVLEPGTNKVKPVFQNDSDEPQSRGDTYSGSEHTYFVLETNQSADNGGSTLQQTQAYAVNDLDAEHAYFILEKETS